MASILWIGLVGCVTESVDDDESAEDTALDQSALQDVDEPPSDGPGDPPPNPPADPDYPFPDDPDLPYPGDNQEPIDESQYPIIIDGDACNMPSTVYVLSSRGFCSGVLLADDLVLTAAHCILGDPPLPPLLPNEYSVGRGAEACRQTEAWGAALAVHPGFTQPGGDRYDIALLRLRQPMTNATVATVGSRATRGTSVLLNGYGRSTPTGPSGTQRCAITRSVGTTDGMTQLAWGNGQCFGDSGGPLFRAGTTTVVGINSSSDPTTPACQGHAYSTIIPRQWLAQAIAQLESQTPGACTEGARRRCRPENGACLQTDDNGEARGACHLGERVCTGGVWSECQGYVGPTSEACGNGADDDCDGQTDEGCGGTPTCGDGTCAPTEDATTCPADCSGGSSCICGWDCPPSTPGCGTCGDGNCDVVSEDSETCPYDCALCGDGFCNPVREDAWSCPADCDGGSSCICGWDCPPGTPACSGWCGDGTCDAVTENASTCPYDCALCGDGICSDWQEDEWSCPVDCGDGGSCICGWDCPPGTPGCGGFCGDGVCDVVTENASSCPLDCSSGGGGGAGGGGDYGSCSGDDFWWWYDNLGWEVAAEECMLAY